MYLNTTTQINKAVCGSYPGSIRCKSKYPHLYTRYRHLVAGSPEYKLNSGFRVLKTHTFSCTGAIL